MIVPPATLLNDCPVVAPIGADQVSVIQTLIKNYESLGKCNADKKGLRDWVEAQQNIYKQGK